MKANPYFDNWNLNAPINTTTKPSSSSINSVIPLKSLWTSFPDSENHFEKREWELISNSRAWVYLWQRWVCKPTIKEVNYRWDRRIASFCARARHKEVLPVPGGPCNSTTRFQDTRFAMILSFQLGTKMRPNSQSTFASLSNSVAWI